MHISRTALLPFLALAGQAQAEEFSLSFRGEAVFEVKLEHNYDSDDVAEERSNTFGRAEIVGVLQLTEEVSVEGLIVAEPLKDPAPNEDCFFDDEGAYFEELKINYDADNWGAYAGKIDPVFGIAWDWGRGI
jgi:hypothetical protein